MQLSGRESMGFLRSVGGLLLGVGAILVLTRRTGSSGADEFERALIAAVPAIVLYLLAIGASARVEPPDGEPWRSVQLVTSLLLAPVALLLLAHWLGANTDEGLWAALVFVIVALLAGYASRRARVPYAMLLAALFLLIAWVAVWVEAIGNPSLNTVRALLVAGGALLLFAAAALARRRGIGGGELATAGALAAVIAGASGALVGYFNAVGGVFSEGPSEPLAEHGSRELQSLGWNIYLLLVSLALVWLAARSRVRGLGYVGGSGLFVFVIGVGAAGTTNEGGLVSTSIGGWPVALVVAGVLALIVPAVRRRAR